MPSDSTWTWVYHPDLLWVPGKHIGDGAFQIKDISLSLYHPEETSGIVGCLEDEDNDIALHLGKFADRDVLHHVRRRYEHDVFHTWLGPVLIAVNPKRPMPLYTSRSVDSMKLYEKSLDEPHPFAVAAKALDNLIRKETSQWIIATGSPTSGRQHFNRVIIQYLSQYNEMSGYDPVSERIGVNTLKAIEILRSLTEVSIENYRAAQISMYLWFDKKGKLMQTEFQPCWMVFRKASSRASPTFDILSYLEKGSDNELRKELGLSEKEASFSEVSGFETILLYFSDLGVSSQSISALLQLFACILRLRQCRHYDKIEHELESVFYVIDMDVRKTLTTDGVTVCENRLNVFIENLYAIAFDWVSRRLNQCLECPEKGKQSWNYIAIPDVLCFQSEEDLLVRILSDFRQTQLQQLFFNYLVQENLRLIQESGISVNFDASKDFGIPQEKSLTDLICLAEGETRTGAEDAKSNLVQIRDSNEIQEIAFNFHASSFFRSCFADSCEESYNKRGFRFYTQLVKQAHDAILIKMQQCDLQFACCISPNVGIDRLDFSSKYCADQLSRFIFPLADFYSKTFVKHFSAKDFMKEYHSVLPAWCSTSNALPKFFSIFNIESDELVFGSSNNTVFIKSKALKFLTKVRSLRERFAAKLIQKQLRSHVLKRNQARSSGSKIQSPSPRSLRNASFQDLSKLLTMNSKSDLNTKSLQHFHSADNELALSFHVCKDIDSLLLYCDGTKMDASKLCSSQLLLAIRQDSPTRAKLWLQRCWDIGHDIGEVRLEHAERFITSAAFRLVDEICKNGGKIQFQSSPEIQSRKIRDPFCTDFTPVVDLVRGINQFKNFSLLRKPRIWARPKKLMSLSKAPAMLEYQDISLHKTLIKVASWRLHGSGKRSPLKRDALEIFNDLLGFIKARPQVCREALANEICKKGRTQVLLRDEIYCQILKQSNKPPNREIEALVWKMLFMCLLSFQPMTEDLGRIVFSHICSRLSSPVVIERYHVLDTVEDIAANCFKAFLSMHKSSLKLSAISIQTIQQINHSVKYCFRCYIFCVDRHLELERDAVRCPKLPSDCKDDEIGINGRKRSTYVDMQIPGFENAISGSDLIDWIVAKSDLVKRIGTVSDQLLIAFQDKPGNPIQRTGIDKSMNVSEMLATVSYRCTKQRLTYWMELYPGVPLEDPHWDVSVTRSSYIEDSNMNFSEVD